MKVWFPLWICWDSRRSGISSDYRFFLSFVWFFVFLCVRLWPRVFTLGTRDTAVVTGPQIGKNDVVSTFCLFCFFDEWKFSLPPHDRSSVVALLSDWASVFFGFRRGSLQLRWKLIHSRCLRGCQIPKADDSLHLKKRKLTGPGSP